MHRDPICPLPNDGVSGLSDSWVEHLSEQSRLRRYVFQAEHCPNTGRLHYHFALQWVSSKSGNQVVRTFSCQGWLHPNIRSCSAHRKPFLAAWRYASKAKSFVEGSRREKGGPPRGARASRAVTRAPYDGYSELREQWWQRLVIVLLRCPPSRRTALWFWERLGNAGKSILIRHCVIMFGDILVIHGGGRDVFSAVADWVSPISKEGKALPGRKLRAVIVDVARSASEDFCPVAAEKLLDGCYLTRKYRSRAVLHDPIHFIVFSNSPPERRLLSEDRWAVYWVGGNPGQTEPQP